MDGTTALVHFPKSRPSSRQGIQHCVLLGLSLLRKQAGNCISTMKLRAGWGHISPGDTLWPSLHQVGVCGELSVSGMAGVLQGRDRAVSA